MSFLELYRLVSLTVFLFQKDATLHQTYVGQKIELLMITSSTQSVFAVCSQFGTYVKFLIKSNAIGIGTVTHQTSIALNACDVMMDAQRRLQMADGGLPFPIVVKDSRDHLFNDLICLMREMNIKWVDPGAPFLKSTLFEDAL